MESVDIACAETCTVSSGTRNDTTVIRCVHQEPRMPESLPYDRELWDLRRQINVATINHHYDTAQKLTETYQVLSQQQ